MIVLLALNETLHTQNSCIIENTTLKPLPNTKMDDKPLLHFEKFCIAKEVVPCILIPSFGIYNFLTIRR